MKCKRIPFCAIMFPVRDITQYIGEMKTEGFFRFLFKFQFACSEILVSGPQYSNRHFHTSPGAHHNKCTL